MLARSLRVDIDRPGHTEPVGEPASPAAPRPIGQGHLDSPPFRETADDAVQEAWLRLSRSDASDVTNLGGRLTTIVARVCLDMLRSRRSRREESLDEAAGPTVGREERGHPEHETVLAESVGIALLVVLDRLAPAERVAFVLHDMFDLPFEEVAAIVGRSPAAARQLASRARRRVKEATVPAEPDRVRQGAVVDAFLAASRRGDLGALLALLDPDVVARADAVAVRAGAPAEIRGAAAVADMFSGRARAAQPATVDGAPGLAWAPGGPPRVVFTFTVGTGRVLTIDLNAEPERLAALDLVLLDG